MSMCVCGTWKKGDNWVSRKSGNGKLKPDGDNLGNCHGTVVHEIRFWRERRAWFGSGPGRGFSDRGLCGISGSDGLGLQTKKQMWGERRSALERLSAKSSHSHSSTPMLIILLIFPTISQTLKCVHLSSFTCLSVLSDVRVAQVWKLASSCFSQRHSTAPRLHPGTQFETQARGIP